MPTIEIRTGDLTQQDTDAIVNAANSSCLGGGGVDGAIHRAAGPELLEACREIRSTQLPDGLPVGHAIATEGFNLPARWVIHTVGPNRHAGETNPADLEACFTESLRLAHEIGAESIAFPAISGGVYGWPMNEVASAAARAVSAFADDAGSPSSPSLIRFVLFADEAAAIFKKVFASAELG